ncbi:virion protein [Proteus phage vB_PmiP_RS8pmA]|uniref:Virion protein n=1 Tax=Proteus phage vB_PmiP_RS8pmA TaxID=2250314 RepID=A0A514CYC9_9CAUD|nr:virion protein [Proteus phage vB_PmiP_RS8pmA]
MSKINRTVLHNNVPTVQLFSTGGCVRSYNDFFMDTESNLWKYTGVLPVTVPPNTTPESTEWLQITNKPQDTKEGYKPVVHFRDLGGTDGLNTGLYKIAHDFCNTHKLSLSYEGMNLIIEDRNIVVTTPTVFKCTITVRINQSNKGEDVFLFQGGSYSSKNLSFNYDEYSDRPFSNVLDVPELSFIKWKPIVPHFNGGDKAIQEMCVHTSGGGVVGRTYSAYTGTTEVYYRSIGTTSFKFEGLTVHVQDTTPSTSTGYFEIFKITDLDSVYISDFSTGTQSPVNNPKVYFGISNCYGVFISDVRTTGTYSKNSGTYGYIFNIVDCINVNFSDITGNVVTKDWWTLYGANRVKVINHHNCHFYRYDNHSFVQDVSASNCTTRGTALSGNGYRRFRDCDFVFSSEEDNGNLLYLRGVSSNGDYSSFNGDISIVGGSISGNPKDFYVFAGSALGASVSLNNEVFNSLVIDGVNFDRLKPSVSASVFPNRSMNRTLFRRFEMRNCTIPIKFAGFSRHDHAFVQEDGTQPCSTIDFNNVKFRAVQDYEDVNSKRFEMSAQLPVNSKCTVSFSNCTNVGFWGSYCTVQVHSSTLNAVRCTQTNSTDTIKFFSCVVLNWVSDNFLLDNTKVSSYSCSADGKLLTSSSSTGTYTYLTNLSTLHSMHLVLNSVYPSEGAAKTFATPYSTFLVVGSGVKYKSTAENPLAHLG